MTQKRSPIGAGLHAIAAALTRPPAPEQDREIIHIHQLDLQHLGRWVLVPAKGRWDEDRDLRTDAAKTTAGRLVGIRHGHPDFPDVRTDRILVIQQGSQIGEITFELDRTIHVAPRSWS